MRTPPFVLIAALVLSLGACAPDDTADQPTPDDSADDAMSASLIGVWIAVTGPENGEVQTIAVYKRGFFKKKLAYEVSTQIIRDETITGERDWGFLLLDGDEMAFDSKADRLLETLPAAPLRFSVTGDGIARRMTVDGNGEIDTFRLNPEYQCGGEHLDCIDHFGCKAGWCIPDRSF